MSAATGSPAAVQQTQQQQQVQQPPKPVEVKVNAFVQANHDSVMGFLNNFNVDAFKDVKNTHVAAKVWKTTNLVVSIVSAFMAGVSAFANFKGHRYVAIGAGIVTLFSLANGRKETLNATKEFTDFTKASDAAAVHLTSAFGAKAQFMIDQVNGRKNGWLFNHDAMLSNQYDDLNNKSIDVDAITTEQTQWRTVHKELAAAADSKDFAQIKDGNTHLNAVLEKLAKARDLILHGRSPVATEPKDETYVQYTGKNKSDVTASVWA